MPCNNNKGRERERKKEKWYNTHTDRKNNSNVRGACRWLSPVTRFTPPPTPLCMYGGGGFLTWYPPKKKKVFLFLFMIPVRILFLFLFWRHIFFCFLGRNKKLKGIFMIARRFPRDFCNITIMEEREKNLWDYMASCMSFSLFYYWVGHVKNPLARSRQFFSTPHF